MNPDDDSGVRGGGATDPVSPVDRENPALLGVLHEHLAFGDTFLDVGANLGVFAIDIALHVGPQGKILAFEPASDSAVELKARAELAGVSDRIEIFQMALGSGTAERSLHFDRESPHDWTKRSLYSSGPVMEKVPVRAFDDLVLAGEVRLPSGLQGVKIDVEGAEVEALRGMSRALVDLRPRVIIIETIPSHQRRAGASVDAIDRLLSDAGYAPLPGGARFVYNAVYVPGPSVL